MVDDRDLKRLANVREDKMEMTGYIAIPSLFYKFP